MTHRAESWNVSFVMIFYVGKDYKIEVLFLGCKLGLLLGGMWDLQIGDLENATWAGKLDREDVQKKGGVMAM